MLPAPLAEDIIKALEPALPPDQMRYVRSVVKDGKSIDTKKELDTLIFILNRNLWPLLMEESQTDPETGERRPLRKDVTDRLKVMNSLLSLRNQVEKREDDGEASDVPPLLRLFRERGMETRVAVMIEARSPELADAGHGPEPADPRGSPESPRLGPGSVGRDTDGTEWSADEA